LTNGFYGDTIFIVDLVEILQKHREHIIEEWVNSLHTGASERYRERPLEELFITVSAAYDASCAVLTCNDFSLIDCHIEWITTIRLQGSFSLSEVQNAYECFRTGLLPVLVKELKGHRLQDVLRRLNACLFYTITKFSDYFQSLHERQIKDHAQNLEGEVEKRTRELAESESKYRVLVEDINDGYFVNQNGKIVFANQAYCDLHGFTPYEMIGKSYMELVTPKSLPAVRRLYENRMVGEDTEEMYIYFRRHKDGSSLPTENKVKRIFYQGEYAVAGICRDITERMETEKRMRESERLAHIGKLTTSLAHEIRNPLSSVKMNIQIILKNTEFNGNDKRRMEIIANEISRLEGILNEMLDFARPVRLNLEPASINEVIDSCLEMMEAKIREKNIAVVKRYSKKIPLVSVDHEKLEQAIINILLNSVEVLPDRGRIEVATKQTMRNGKAVKIEISDNGPGISTSDLPYIFDPFFSNKKKGTGLGLSNVKKIIEAHGGAERVTLRKPQGICFSLTVPFREIN
jgi:PAS domain S-box-containing protein